MKGESRIPERLEEKPCQIGKACLITEFQDDGL